MRNCIKMKADHPIPSYILPLQVINVLAYIFMIIINVLSSTTGFNGGQSTNFLLISLIFTDLLQLVICSPFGVLYSYSWVYILFIKHFLVIEKLMGLYKRFRYDRDLGLLFES